jgi:hypothetical protein
MKPWKPLPQMPFTSTLREIIDEMEERWPKGRLANSDARDDVMTLIARVRELEAERDQARAEEKELRETLNVAGERLKACSYELTEFSYQEMASVLLDLPSNTEEPTNG